MKYRFSLVLIGAMLFSHAAKAQPAVASYSPNYGASNDAGFVFINGTGLGSGSAGLVVKYNGVQDPSAYANVSTQIQTHVPTGAPKGTYPLFVSVNGQQAPTNSGVFFTVIGPYDPYADSFSPSSGQPGQTVTFTGTHFNLGGNITAVKFNGVSASFGPIISDSMFTAILPVGVTTGPVTVEKTGYSTFVSSSNFYVAPTITGFSPSSGRAGTNVVIRGTSFTNASAVTFGALNAASFTINSNSQITAVAPNGVLTGPIAVVAPAGQFITSSNFLVSPTVTGFSPGFGAVGTSVTVTGANFNAGTPSVKFGDISAAPSSVTFSQLKVTVPAGATNAPVSVTSTDGSGVSPQIFFLPPTISGFAPTSGAAGTTVTISGTNFAPLVNSVTAVTFNGTPATAFVVSNNNSIGAVVPVGVITGPIGVATPGGTSNSTSLFYGTPVINSFTPATGAPGSSVMISGTNFLGATVVSFTGGSATFTVTNNGVLGATVPNTATTGPLTVTAPGGTATSAASFVVNSPSDLFVTNTDSPDPVFVGSNLVYTISILNNGPFAAPNVMLTNTLPATVALKSASTSQGTLNTNANPILGSLGTLNNGAAATVTLTVVPQTAGYITNTAAIGSDNPDPNLANNSSAQGTLVWPLPFLSIQNLTGNQVKVFWPAPLSNFTLLFQTNLVANAAWNTDLNTRVLSSTNISVSEIGSNTAKFFRLKQ